MGDRLAYQQKTGIGEQRCAGIAGQGHGLTLAELIEQPWETLALVVLMERQQLLLDPQVAEEPAGTACVLAGDEVGLLERGASAR